MTRLAESAHCIYLAIAQVNGQAAETDIDTDLSRAKAFFNVDATAKEIRKSLTPSWLKSAADTGNHLINKLKYRDYVFHRSSADVKKIETKFRQVNAKLEEPFKDINKWNPADIWAIRKGYILRLGNIKSIDELNFYLRAEIDFGNILPLSLKKIASNNPKIESINTNESLKRQGKPTELPKFVEATIVTGKGNWTTSKSAIIRFELAGKIGLITIRNSQRGKSFNCEVKMMGANHNMGKFSRDTATKIINAVAPRRIPAYNISELSRKSYSLDPVLLREVYEMGKRLDPMRTDFTFDEFNQLITSKSTGKDADPDWLAGKYQGMLVIDSINSMSARDKQSITEAIFSTARAQSELSGPFLEIK